MTTRSCTRFGRLALPALGALLAGCAASGPPDQPADEVNTALSRLRQPDAANRAPPLPDPGTSTAEPREDLARLADQTAIDLERLLAGQRGEPDPATPADSPGARPEAVTHAAEPQPESALSAAPTPAEQDRGVNAGLTDVLGSKSPAIDPAPIDADADLRAAAARTLELLEARGEGGDAPVMHAVAAAALRHVAGGSDAAASASHPTDALPPDLAATLRAVNGLFGTLASGNHDPQVLAEALRASADDLAALAGLRISHAELCTSVQGFGRFVPLPSRTLLAGRTHRMIVYTQVENFSIRRGSAPASVPDAPAAGDAPWVVELSQELLLLHAADSTLAWHRPPQKITDASRSRVRDFYLVHEVTLPETLSVGSYVLKVVMRDPVSGSTDEALLDLRVVADPSLAGGARSR